VATLFADQLREQFGTWPLGYIPYGGADFGEIAAVATAIGDGDDGAYHAARLYLRASAFHATSFHPLYGAPVDPRLLDAFRCQTAAFNGGLALGHHPPLS
jgi:hypothetical protein